MCACRLLLEPDIFGVEEGKEKMELEGNTTEVSLKSDISISERGQVGTVGFGNSVMSL